MIKRKRMRKSDKNEFRESGGVRGKQRLIISRIVSILATQDYTD